MTQHPDIIIWILTGVVGVLLAGLWFSIKKWIDGINRRIDDMMAQLIMISKQNVGFEKDIMRLDKSQNSQDERMRDHSYRIRDVENKLAGCRNCTGK
jgi:hypothetical protein